MDHKIAALLKTQHDGHPVHLPDSCFHRSGDRTVEETGERQEEAGNQGDRRRDILGTRNPIYTNV